MSDINKYLVKDSTQAYTVTLCLGELLLLRLYHTYIFKGYARVVTQHSKEALPRLNYGPVCKGYKHNLSV
jgi:hypothetical protein